jgi:hypothetical protein
MRKDKRHPKDLDAILIISFTILAGLWAAFLTHHA